MAIKKYLSLDKLTEYDALIKTEIDKRIDASKITIDSELSSTSTNPVQNKVLNDEFEAVSEAMSKLETSIDGKSDSTHNHDDVYETKTDSATKLEEAKSYADSAATALKNELLNGAGGAYDTLKELGDLIDENQDAIDALEIIASAKPDWNQNDETAADYIKNRPFGMVAVENEIINTNLNFTAAEYLDNIYFTEDFTSVQLTKGMTYNVYWNGEQYSCVALDGGEDYVYIGNYHMSPDWEVAETIESNEPFFIVTNSDFSHSLASTSSNTPVTLQVMEMVEAVKQLDEKFLPDNIATEEYVDTSIEKIQSELVFDSIKLRDISTGFVYLLQIKDGIIVTSSKVTGISMTTQPNKTTYMVGETVDLTGMIIEATCEDGSVKNVASDVTYSPEVITDGVTSIEVKYYSGGSEYIVTVPIRVIASIEELLIDFEYTDNNDGTYTLTGWKQTLNGEPSTEMVIPDNSSIKL